MNEPHSHILFAPFHAASPFHAVFGRTDVVNAINDFVFTPASKSAFENFTIVDDSVLEFDEIFIAEFNFDPEISNKWNVSKGEPSTAFIRITDDDCELCSDIRNPQHLICTIVYSTYLTNFQVATFSLSIFLYLLQLLR